MFVIVGLGSFLLAAAVRWWMMRTYKIWGQVANRLGADGKQVARHILDVNGLQHVTLERSQGQLSDHYIPSRELIRLSPAVSDDASVASIAVAAHEVGHALQKNTQYLPLKAKGVLMPLAAIGNKLGMVLLLGSGVAGIPGLLNVGMVLLASGVFVQLLTLPIEFDASRRALDELQRLKLVDEQDLSGAKTMLTAAALTYVASAASSMAYVAVIAMSFLRRR